MVTKTITVVCLLFTQQHVHNVNNRWPLSMSKKASKSVFIDTLQQILCIPQKFTEECWTLSYRQHSFNTVTDNVLWVQSLSQCTCSVCVCVCVCVYYNTKRSLNKLTIKICLILIVKSFFSNTI